MVRYRAQVTLEAPAFLSEETLRKVKDAVEGVLETVVTDEDWKPVLTGFELVPD